ncbi:hypothetical protein Pcinc_022057 [Petrolisthes cinctipes]|uniref:PHD finger protein rhinoceros n=1 Tax=Petrolisthes cinctipes TaxID=88211 RepID=A0AAE1FEU4_PETCI|nr:hypothetical protein Pcinc_022057 [Petrolisthes cinctipes]
MWVTESPIGDNYAKVKMSQRIKRQLSKAGGSVEGGGGGSSQTFASRKKRRIDNSASDDEERSVWTPKHLGDLRAYNRSASEAPAELFRKDLISAMKLADNEPLSSDDYWGIGDPWKQEWERGVQVPVNPDSLPESSVTVTLHKPVRDREANFRLTKDKLIRVNHDEFFSNEQHILSNLPTKAEKMCRYDMDDLDDQWLTAYNGERARMGAAPVPPLIFEMIVEHLEETCWENIHKMLKTEESLSIEFDEDVICDVCRSPDSEEGNEMVFCDSCNICVHQACYGITAIPSGSWLCRTCSLGIKPDCVLCPNKGGAMKSTKSGQKWAHVACALWIPEVSIGSVERMEPITKIPNIPQSRWALVCVLCRERRGACIQCSVKTCKTAYHVTCAFKHGLEMKAIIEDESADDGVKLRSYCEKHSVSSKKLAADEGESEEGEDSTAPKKKKDWSSEQKNQARAAKLRQIESEFYKHVDVLETSNYLDIDFETTETIYNYWKLKRRASFNKPLLTPRSEEIDLLSQQQEHDIERMKMFVQLRQYLERVRNLCYMVNRRERLSRSFIKTREQTFSKQVALLSAGGLSPQEAEAIRQANHGPSVYDQLYSHPGAPRHSQKQFKKMVAAITGGPGAAATAAAPVPRPRKVPQKKDINGLIRPKKEKTDNPYKKLYMNGAEQRRSRSSSLGTTTDSDSSLPSSKWTLPAKSSGRYPVYTTSEEDTNKENHSLKLEPPTPKPRPAFLHHTDKESGAMTVGTRGGRMGRKRRGMGRATVMKSKSFRDRVGLSGDDRDTKDFDALISDKTVKIEPNTSSSRATRGVETSEDEADVPPPKPKPQPTRRRTKKKVTPPKVESSASSEDDPPAPTLTLVKDKKPARRGGRWGKSVVPGVGVGGGGLGSAAAGSEATSASSPALEPPKLELSDDDELLPPTYKLSSDDDEKSHDGAALSSDGMCSDRTDSSSDNAPDSTLSKEPKKSEKKGETVSSDSDVNSDDANKDSTIDSQNHATLKTKAAKKEFTPKIEAKVERMNKKKGGRAGKKVGEKIKVEGKQAEEVEGEPTNMKVAETEATQGHLFVPQRKAAKKASELITSQNTTSTAATTTTATTTTANTTPAHNTTLPDTKKITSKLVREVKEEVEEVEPEEKKLVDEKKVVEEKKVPEEKRGTPTKGRKGKVTREKSDRTTTDEPKTEAVEAPKKNLFEPPEILPYVPMRQAARKAAENLKGGNNKAGPSVTSGTEEIEAPPTPATSPAKAKRISRQESRVTGRAKSKSPRAAKQHSPVIATERESGSEAENASVMRRPAKDQKDQQKGSKSIFSDSEEECVAAGKKERVVQVRPDPILEVKDTHTGEQFFRGEIFLREYQSSSDNESSGPPGSPGGKQPTSPGSAEDESRENARILHPIRASSVDGDLHLTSDSDEREDENQEPAIGTRRKAPDKKLKTSEGRPEHGFQPPVTERGESRVSAEKEATGASIKPGGRREGGGLESRLRQSGAECGPRTGTGDLPLQDIPSHIDAPPRTGHRGGGREREPPPLPGHRPTSREVQSKEPPQLRTGRKTTEGSSQEKLPPPTRGLSSSKKEETVVVKETDVTRQRREGLRDKGEAAKEKDKGEVTREKDKADLLKGRERRTEKDKEDRLGELNKSDKNEMPSLPRERILSSRDSVLPSREKLTSQRGSLPVKDNILTSREAVASKEKRDVKAKQPVEEDIERRGKVEGVGDKSEVCVVEALHEPAVEIPKSVTNSRLSRETSDHLSKAEGKETKREGEVAAKNSEKEEEVQRRPGVFGYVEEEEVKVEHLEDIVETSDTEPETKKVRISDSDEECVVADSAEEKRRVEQPKDSGYKSAINTPEPVDRVQVGCPELVTVNTVVNNYLSEAASGDMAEVGGKTPVEPSPSPVPVLAPATTPASTATPTPPKVSIPTLTPVSAPASSEAKQHAPNKFLSPTRKKNLEDVIGEMKRQAEAQPEPSASATPTPTATSRETPSPSSEVAVTSPPSSQSFPLPQSEGPATTSQAVTEGPANKNGNTATEASFVEQWRGQWVKSPTPAEHEVDPPGSLPPHLPMPGLDMGMASSMSLLDVQRALYPDQQLFSFDHLINTHHGMLPPSADPLNLNRFRHILEPGPPLSMFPPGLPFLQQHPAATATPDMAALTQYAQAQAQASRDTENAEDRMRLPILDAPSPSPDLTSLNKANSRSSTKVAKQLPSPLLVAPPHPSPPTKVLPGLSSPSTTTPTTTTTTTTTPAPTPVTTTTTTSSVSSREESVLAHSKVTPAPVSPPSAFNKCELAETPPSDRSLLLSRAATIASDQPHFPAATKVSKPAVSPTLSTTDVTTKVSQSLASPPVNSVFGNKKSFLTHPPSSVAATPHSSLPVLPTTTSSNSSTTASSSSTSTVTTTTTTVTTTSTTTTSSVVSAVSKSPMPVVSSPATHEQASPQVETITVEDSPTPQREEQTTISKRVPIYMQEPRVAKQEKRSPRSRTLSPRWNKEPPSKPREKKSGKGGRGGHNKGNRGKSAGKGKGRGHSPRFNSVSVPKELVGTVYDFDFDNEFDDDGPANNTLDDLRRSREKRQSVDTVPQQMQQQQPQQQQQSQQQQPQLPQPAQQQQDQQQQLQQQQSTTPTYSTDQKEQSPKKSGKKSKSLYKDKASARPIEEDHDKVAKILEDYRNTQNNQLRRSAHSPSPPLPDSLSDGGRPKTPDLQTIPQFTAELATSISESKLTVTSVSEAREAGPAANLSTAQKEVSDHGKVALNVPTAHLGIDERTNQLKLKIKGPYANSYSSSSAVPPPPEASGAPAPASTTSTLRRMRKKELIRQYQDQLPTEASDAGPISSAPNPTPHIRTGITIPKAIASMTSIPTREDYKMYTQDDSASGSRRKRPTRELRHLNVWAIKDEAGKRNSEATDSSDPSRKRARSAKDTKSSDEKDVWSAKPPPKLRISLSKKGSEVTTVPPDNTGKQPRPPKKRLAEENPMVKIKSDSMKFREQIMADFDRPGKKGMDREKKNKKRRVYSGEGGGSGSEAKEGDSGDKHDIKVIAGDSTNAPKLVIRIGKGKSDNIGLGGGTGNGSGGSSSKVGSDDPESLTPSLKIRLSLPKPDSDSSKEESTATAKVPLKLKLSRRPDGYVASNTPRKPQPDVQDRGPGPPASRPPDQPPSMSQPEQSVTDTSAASPTCSLPPKPYPIDTGPSPISDLPPDPGIAQDTPPAPPPPPVIPYEVYPHQADPPTAGGQEQLGLGPAEYGLGGLGPPGIGPPPPRPELSDEMLMQRLQAQLAAGAAAAAAGQPPQQQTLIDVPGIHHTLYPYKEGSDCR